jgi:hypothetical protein
MGEVALFYSSIFLDGGMNGNEEQRKRRNNIKSGSVFLWYKNLVYDLQPQ